MANANANRLGQDNLSGDQKALFLKVFGGEVLTTFTEKNKFMGKHRVRSIASGKSVSFPAIGKATARYHTPGDEITGQNIAHSERVITLDDLLISDVFIPEIDEAMNHYDVRRDYSRQLGSALARTFDKNVARVMGIAARSSATIDGLNGGTILTDANALADADTLASGLFDAAAALDEKDVPEEERFAFVKPTTFYNLIQNGTKVIHKDYDGRGSYAEGNLPMVAGFTIVPTNNLPTTDESADATIDSDYRADFSTTACLAVQRQAVGTAKLIDLGVELGWDMRRQGTLGIAKYSMGHGVLRPECAVEIRTADPAVA